MSAEPQSGGRVEPLQVAVRLSDPHAPGNGALRLLDHLASDPRYDLCAVWAVAQLPAEGAGVRAALERRIVPMPPVYAPQFATLVPKVAAIPDRIPDCDVLIDFGWPDSGWLDSGGPDSGGPDIGGAEGVRHGIWRLSACCPDAGVGEAMSGAPATAVDLWRDGRGRDTIARAVYDTKFLARRNTEYIREKSVQLIVQALARLHRDGALTPVAAAEASGPVSGSLAGYGLRTLAKVADRVRDRAAARFGGSPGGFGLRIGRGDITDFDPAAGHDLPMPPGHFWADPFLIEEAGQVFCLFEDYDYATGLGQIGAGVLTDSGMEYLGPAHVAPHHLSFPFVFRHGDAIYMMPETHQAGRLEIWRATGFPLHWTLYATAFEHTGGPADAVLFRQGGDWWLFTGLCRDSFGDFCGELHLFRVSGPDLAWVRPHPINPIVIGADTARGGGRVHVAGDRLLRVSQDNSGGIYGWGLNILEIDRLTADDYAEHRTRHVTPGFAPGLIGCHHFDCAGGRWVMDVRRP